MPSAQWPLESASGCSVPTAPSGDPSGERPFSGHVNLATIVPRVLTVVLALTAVVHRRRKQLNFAGQALAMITHAVRHSLVLAVQNHLLMHDGRNIFGSVSMALLQVGHL